MATSSNPEPQEQLWEWKRPECKREGARITLYNNISVLRDIEIKLLRVGSGPSLLNRFLDGCFGNLLAWRGGISCGKALHELLAHEIKISGSPSDQYWFRICGQNLRFYYPEFALVSGLRFGTSEFDPTAPHEPEETRAYKLFYNGYGGLVSMKDLLTKFKNCSEDVDPTGDCFLKVANILALYYFVLGYSETKIIDSFAWVLVDNLKAWNEFPWGAYSYQAFTHYMSLLPNTKAECREVYSFYGPAWVLQKWSYEAIPYLGEIVAMKMVTVDYTSLFEQQSECEQFLAPDEEEVKSVHWLSVLTDSPLGVKYIAPRTLIRLRRAESIAVSEGDHMKKKRRERKDASGIQGKKRITVIEKDKQRKKSVSNIDEESDWEVQMKKKKRKKLKHVPNESLACRLPTRTIKVITSEEKPNWLPSSPSTTKLLQLANTVLHGIKSNEGDCVPSVLACSLQNEDNFSINAKSIALCSQSSLSHVPKLGAHLRVEGNPVETEKLGQATPIEASAFVQKTYCQRQSASYTSMSLNNAGMARNSHAREDGMFGKDLSTYDKFLINDSNQMDRLHMLLRNAPPKKKFDANLRRRTLRMHFGSITRDNANIREKVNKMMTRGADGTPMVGMAEGMSTHHRTSSTVSVRKKLFESTSKKYDPLELSFEINALESFSASLEEKIKNKLPLDITLPLKAKNVAKVGWFDSILQRTRWLGDEHVDALLNLIIFKANVGYAKLLSDWTILEALGTVALNQENFEKTSNGPIMMYVDGFWPVEGPKSWVDARRVLGVANIDQSHWVCYEIILENQLIMVYDSMTSKRSWSKVVKALHNMTKYLPKLCKKAGIWEKKGLTTLLKDQWDLELFKDTPQQANGSDCGIMSIKCVECLVSGNPVTSIDPDRCGMFRKMYCYQLCHMGLSCPSPLAARRRGI